MLSGRFVRTLLARCRRRLEGSGAAVCSILCPCSVVGSCATAAGNHKQGAKDDSCECFHGVLSIRVILYGVTAFGPRTQLLVPKSYSPVRSRYSYGR